MRFRVGLPILALACASGTSLTVRAQNVPPPEAFGLLADAQSAQLRNQCGVSGQKIAALIHLRDTQFSAASGKANVILNNDIDALAGWQRQHCPTTGNNSALVQDAPPKQPPLFLKRPPLPMESQAATGLPYPSFMSQTAAQRRANLESLGADAINCADSKASPDTIIRLCTKALEGLRASRDGLPPTIYAILDARGIAYQASGKPQLAITDYSQSIKLMSDDRTAYTLRAVTYIQLREFDRAIADANIAIALFDKEPGAEGYSLFKGSLLAARGDGFAGKKNFRSALADYREAYSIFPQVPGLADNIKKTEQALRSASSGVQTLPTGNDSAGADLSGGVPTSIGKVLILLCPDSTSQTKLQINLTERSVVQTLEVTSPLPTTCVASYVNGRVGAITDANSCQIPFLGAALATQIVRQYVTTSASKVEWGVVPVNAPLTREEGSEIDLIRNVWTDNEMNNHRCRPSRAR